MPESRVCLGVITGAHGVRGQVKIKSFTEVPEDLAAYGPLEDEAGERVFQVSLTGHGKSTLLARIEGLSDRDQAQALAGTGLYLPRERLPTLSDREEFYHADLIGLAAEDPEGRALGRVRAVHNFGAGDLLELEAEPAPGTAGGSTLIPFTKAVVPKVDLAARRLVVRLPAEVEAAPPAGPEARRRRRPRLDKPSTGRHKARP